MLIQTKHLKAAALFQASKEVTRYYLRGVCIDTIDGNGFIVATDGHRMFAANVGAVDWNQGQIVISSDTVKKALTGYREETIELLPAVGVAGETAFTLGDIRFTPIDGKFPDWRRVFPLSISGDLAQFNAGHVGDMAKASKILGGPSDPFIGHNGVDAAVVTFGNANVDCCALLMPMKPLADVLFASAVADQFRLKPNLSVAA